MLTKSRCRYITLILYIGLHASGVIDEIVDKTVCTLYAIYYHGVMKRNRLHPSRCFYSSHLKAIKHWGRVTHTWVGNLATIDSDNLNQCWNIVNSNIRNKFQWNLKRNSNIFIQGNAFENVVCEMAVILYRPQCVKKHINEFRTTSCGWFPRKMYSVYTKPILTKN